MQHTMMQPETSHHTAGPFVTPAPAWATTMAFGLALLGTTLVVKSTHSAVVGTLAGPEVVLPVIGVTSLLLARPARHGDRRTTIGVIVFATLVLLANLRHLVRTLRLPDSAIDFVPNLIAAACLAVVIGSAIAVLRGRRGTTTGQRRFRMATIGILATGALASTTATLVATPPSSDTIALPQIETVGNAYVPAHLSVAPHEQLAFRNADAYAHTFTVTDLGIDVHVPGTDQATVTIPADAQRGIYPVVCVLHPGLMDATLTVIDP